ncbi:MORN repeat-containing protein [Catalinimonas alkaloidigena]|uniref:MORN repeat-containing protein n=1 Tax=Catalinimonas alkaloidigena TaxID=1075417 RepID=A0A1G9A609_9BACT|nr:hypothetical protein [Catalinimonas alkaloidigena]SDK22809.1 MORN repeat-containing protein [Catalinimonas alkaloidigena]
MRKLLPLLSLSLSLTSFGQSNTEPYIPDTKTGCLVVAQNFFPLDSLTIRWDGACKNKMAHGIGTLTYFISNKEVATYQGNVANGSPNGAGKFSSPNGFRWEGNFVNGVLNGKGRVLFPDSTKKLEGNFYDGEILDLEEKYLRALKRNVVSSTDSTALYTNDRNQNELFYYSLIPEGTVEGVIVLLPGTGDRVEYTLSSTKELCQNAFDHHLAVISLSLNQRLTLNDEVLRFINLAFEDAIRNYSVPKDKWIIGGFSMGGLFSLRYTELSVQDRSKTTVIPLAAFSVDGPTDLARMYHTFEVALERSPNKAEPTYALNEFNKYIGGPPETNKENYIYFSTFSHAQKDGGNAAYLADLPVRIYNDVDVTWWLDNRNTDLYGMNALDQSAMIRLLNSLGNQEAEFINSFGKGYRLDGSRHPHSWSIVDPTEFIAWIQRILTHSH